MFNQPEPGKFELAPELAALQRQLAQQLTPAAPRVDRDQLMFDAGRAAERASQDGRAIYLAGPSWAGRTGPNVRATGSASARRFWPAATATMTAATILLSALLVWQRGVRNPSPTKSLFHKQMRSPNRPTSCPIVSTRGRRDRVPPAATWPSATRPSHVASARSPTNGTATSQPPRIELNPRPPVNSLTN